MLGFKYWYCPLHSPCRTRCGGGRGQWLQMTSALGQINHNIHYDLSVVIFWRSLLQIRWAQILNPTSCVPVNMFPFNCLPTSVV